MSSYVVPVQIRWADIDQNRHLRHSAYYDYGAMVRLMFLNERGLTTKTMEQLAIGPVLFREEAVFRREIHLDDKITLDIELLAARADFSRWSLRHTLRKDNGELAAVMQVDGAWIDLLKRKLAAPNEFVQGVFKSMPQAAEFQWLSVS